MTVDSVLDSPMPTNYISPVPVLMKAPVLKPFSMSDFQVLPPAGSWVQHPELL